MWCTCSKVKISTTLVDEALICIWVPENPLFKIQISIASQLPSKKKYRTTKQRDMCTLVFCLRFLKRNVWYHHQIPEIQMFSHEQKIQTRILSKHRCHIHGLFGFHTTSVWQICAFHRKLKKHHSVGEKVRMFMFIPSCLVVSTPLKNISQIGSSSQVGGKDKKYAKPPPRSVFLSWMFHPKN